MRSNLTLINYVITLYSYYFDDDYEITKLSELRYLCLLVSFDDCFKFVSNPVVEEL